MSDLPEVNYPSGTEDLLQYRDLFKQAPIGILRTATDGTILIANQAFAEILGYNSFREFIELTQGNVLHLYEDPLFRRHITDVIVQQPDRPMHFESRWKRKDGTVFPCMCHARPCVDEAGKILYIDGFVEDISEQKAIEEALSAGGERYRSIFENTGTGSIIVEKDGTISLANSGFANLIGYSKDEIEGKMKWTAIVANEGDLKRMLGYHIQRRGTTDKAPLDYEFTMKDRHGNHRDVFVRVDIISGTDCSVASLLDITSLKLAKRNLRESESQLTGILEAFDGYIYRCTIDYQVVYVNRKLKKTMDPQAHGNLLCYNFIFGLDSPCHWCPQSPVFEGKTIRYELQHPLDGRWYYAVSSPIYKDKHAIAQKQTVMIDIHERKLTEIALKEREVYLKKENMQLRGNIRDRYKFGSIIGKSKAMQHIYELILRAAASDANVIIYGESGTGKELVAWEIHNLSDRTDHTFLPVNCGAIPITLMESEFFGYHKGAFTGAEQDKAGYFTKSDHGTLFLDELGEIDEAMQVKLLRVLDGGSYTPLGAVEPMKSDVRIISATNSNLRLMLDKGSIREDFFYRIHIIPITLPPLRDRRDDIPILVEHFMAKHSKGSRSPLLTGHDLGKLMQYDWPGNVRELENTIQRFLNLNILEFVGGGDNSRSITEASITGAKAHPQESLRDAAHQFERQYILEQLEACKWNRNQTAKVLGIQRKTLYLKMKFLNITNRTGN